MGLSSSFVEDCRTTKNANHEKIRKELFVQTGLATCEDLASHLRQISSLSLKGIGISSAAMLREFANIERFNFANNKFKSIVGLPSRPSFTELDFSNNELEEISLPSGIEVIANLNISQNPVTSFDTGTTAIFALDISANKNLDLGFLKNLENTLALTANNINGGSVLALAPDTLLSLTMNDSEVSSLQDLDRFPSLIMLSLKNNKIANLKYLQSAKYIEYLDLSGNDITNVEAIARLDHLDFLLLRNNSIRDIPAQITSVRIDISDNQISDISNLLSSKLQHIVADRNRIESISLQGPPPIELMSVSGNSLSNIDFLKDLPSLTFFNASDNDISAIPRIDNLTELKHLFLRANEIKSISSLKGLKKLELIDFLYNPLGTTIEKNEENCPTAEVSDAVRKWCEN